LAGQVHPEPREDYYGLVVVARPLGESLRCCRWSDRSSRQRVVTGYSLILIASTGYHVDP
jgi:hypothetical protein